MIMQMSRTHYSHHVHGKTCAICTNVYKWNTQVCIHKAPSWKYHFESSRFHGNSFSTGVIRTSHDWACISTRQTFLSSTIYFPFQCLHCILASTIHHPFQRVCPVLAKVTIDGQPISQPQGEDFSCSALCLILLTFSRTFDIAPLSRHTMEH